MQPPCDGPYPITQPPVLAHDASASLQHTTKQRVLAFASLASRCATGAARLGSVQQRTRSHDPPSLNRKPRIAHRARFTPSERHPPRLSFNRYPRRTRRRACRIGSHAAAACLSFRPFSVAFITSPQRSRSFCSDMRSVSPSTGLTSGLTCEACSAFRVGLGGWSSSSAQSRPRWSVLCTTLLSVPTAPRSRAAFGTHKSGTYWRTPGLPIARLGPDFER